MDPQRRKATRSASKAAASTLTVSVQIPKGASTKPVEKKPIEKKPVEKKPVEKKPTRRKPSECPVVPDAAQPEEQKCCSIRASASQRKKSAPAPQERPQVCARGARTQKAPLGPEDFLEGRAILAEPPGAQEPPLSRAGSCRERGARSAREQKSQPCPMEDPRQHLLVPAPSLAKREPATCSWKPKAVLDKLKLRRSEISRAAEVVNKVVDHLLRSLHNSQSEFKFVEKLSTGSYYEQVKVSWQSPPLLCPRRAAVLPHPSPGLPDIPTSHSPSLSFGRNADCNSSVLIKTTNSCASVYSSLHPTNMKPAHIDC